MIFAKIALNKSIFILKSQSNTFKMASKAAGDREMVGICMGAICKKMGMADPASLIQRDLKFLSERIEARTEVLISMSTIRRLLNGQFSRIPQVATLDAIARFLDYANWQDFKTAAQSTAAQTPAAHTQAAHTQAAATPTPPLPTMPRTVRW